MSLNEKLSLLLTHCGMCEEEVAAAIGMSRQHFHRKLKQGAFTIAELERICQALGARFSFAYEFEDGTRV